MVLYTGAMKPRKPVKAITPDERRIVAETFVKLLTSSVGNNQTQGIQGAVASGLFCGVALASLDLDYVVKLVRLAVGDTRWIETRENARGVLEKFQDLLPA